MTLAEFNILAKGYFGKLERRQKQRTSELVFLAWHTALFERQKQLPSWDKVQRSLNSEEEKEQSVDDMITVARALNTAFGGVEVTDDYIRQD